MAERDTRKRYFLIAIACSGVFIVAGVAMKLWIRHMEQKQRERLMAYRMKRLARRRQRKEEKASITMKEEGETDENQFMEEEKKLTGNISDDAEPTDCIICLEKEINCVFLDCGHMYTCIQCANKLVKCPICNLPYRAVVRVYTNQ